MQLMYRQMSTNVDVPDPLVALVDVPQIATLDGLRQEKDQARISGFGVGAENEDFNAWIIGWTQAITTGDTAWIPQVICHATFVLGAQVQASVDFGNIRTCKSIALTNNTGLYMNNTMQFTDKFYIAQGGLNSNIELFFPTLDYQSVQILGVKGSVTSFNFLGAAN